MSQLKIGEMYALYPYSPAPRFAIPLYCDEWSTNTIKDNNGKALNPRYLFVLCNNCTSTTKSKAKSSLSSPTFVLARYSIVLECTKIIQLSYTKYYYTLEDALNHLTKINIKNK